MRKIVISGINIVDGGAKSVYDDLLNAIVSSKLYKSNDFTVLVSKKELFKKYTPYFKIIEFPKSKKHWVNRLYYEYYYFKKLSEVIRPDVWLSMHDITPNVIAKKRYVYCHNPSPFYNMKLKEARYGWKYYLFSKFYKYLYRINIHKNTAVIVQQNWMAKEFKKMYNLDNIVVAKPSISNSMISMPSENHDKINFIYPSFPRPFKNFEVLCQATEILNQHKFEDEFNVYITVDGTENKYSKALKEQYGHVSNIKFIGLQKREDLYKYYAKSDCLVFASKLETWGMPITEFKQIKKPIIVADLPYAHENIGNYSKVNYFNPNDCNELSLKLKSILKGKVSNANEKYNNSNIFLNINSWNEFCKIIFQK